MAAIPGAGSAWHALPGVIRVLLRAAVLGGLLITAWLLGAGLGHADEDPESPPAGLINLVAGSAGGRLHSQPALPAKIGSAAMAAASSSALLGTSTPPQVAVPLAPAPAVTKLDVVKPVLAELSRPVSRIAHPALLPGLVAPKGAVAVAPAPARASPAVRPMIAGPRPAAEHPVPLAAPAGSATQPLPTGVRCAPAGPGSAVSVPAARPAQQGLPEAPTLPVPEPAVPDPVSPGPLSPPPSPSVACPAAGPAGASNAKTGAGVATESSAATIPAGWMQRVRLRDATELPRSLATQPPISPD